VIDRQNLHSRGEEHVVPDGDPSLAPDDARLADEAVLAHPDARMGKAAKIVHVQLSVVHHKCPVADEDPLRAGMQVHPAIQIDVTAQSDVMRHTEANLVLNGYLPSHPKDHLVGHGAQADTDQARYAAQQHEQALLENVAAHTG